jgi:RNA polymerase sigma factor (sigma-70 family)
MMSLSEIEVERQPENLNSNDPCDQQPCISQISDQSFAKAYQKGFQQSVRFLSSRGVPRDLVFDTAQGAWTKAWERREQLRNPSCVLTWVNSIALNLYRSALRRERHTEALVDLQDPKHEMIGASIDAERILNSCNRNDRVVLEAHYIRGFKLDEIARQNNWSETAARIRLLRARGRVRVNLRRKKTALAKAHLAA